MRYLKEKKKKNPLLEFFLQTPSNKNQQSTKTKSRNSVHHVADNFSCNAEKKSCLHQRFKGAISCRKPDSMTKLKEPTKIFLPKNLSEYIKKCVAEDPLDSEFKQLHRKIAILQKELRETEKLIASKNRELHMCLNHLKQK